MSSIQDTEERREKERRVQPICCEVFFPVCISSLLPSRGPPRTPDSTVCIRVRARPCLVGSLTSPLLSRSALHRFSPSRPLIIVRGNETAQRKQRQCATRCAPPLWRDSVPLCVCLCVLFISERRRARRLPTHELSMPFPPNLLYRGRWNSKHDTPRTVYRYTTGQCGRERVLRNDIVALTGTLERERGTPLGCQQPTGKDAALFRYAAPLLPPC